MKIIIVGEAYYADLSIGGGPIIPPGSPGAPTHPIQPVPPGIWGGAPLPWPTPPIYYPPGSPGAPTHPIQPVPPGIWGGPGGLPPMTGHPIAPGGGSPSHPIYLPPGTIPGVPAHPIVIPPPASPGEPSHPIVIPPPPEKPEVLENWEAKTVWTQQTGWMVVIVPTGDQPLPTPSK
jgi:hypothetical protein